MRQGFHSAVFMIAIAVRLEALKEQHGAPDMIPGGPANSPTARHAQKRSGLIWPSPVSRVASSFAQLCLSRAVTR